MDHAVLSDTSVQTSVEQATLWSHFKAQAVCERKREREILIACEKGLRTEEAFVFETVWDNALWLPRCSAFRSWPLFSLLKFRVPLNTLLTICYITHKHTHTFILDELAARSVILFFQGIMTCNSFFSADTVKVQFPSVDLSSGLWNLISEPLFTPSAKSNHWRLRSTWSGTDQFVQVKYELLLKLKCLWEMYFIIREKINLVLNPWKPEKK